MRDKNWVVWKMAGCPPITRSPVEPEKFVAAMSSIQKTATNKRLRPVPLGSVSLDFLRSSADEDGLESLKEKTRFELPELESFKRKIADDDFEIEMPTNEESKAAAVAGKASKSWRALRVAGRFKLAMFDRIDDPKKIDIIFQDPDEALDEDAEAEPTAAEDDMPSNKEPLIIAGPSSVGKTALVEKLLEQHKGVFAPVVRHAVRDPTETEINGKTFHFVKTPEFNQLRDGDRLVEYGTRDGVDYGTSTKAIEAVTESGKVPVIELDLEVRGPVLAVSFWTPRENEQRLTTLHRLHNLQRTWTLTHGMYWSHRPPPKRTWSVCGQPARRTRKPRESRRRLCLTQTGCST